MTASNDRYRAPALDKGLDILELLSEQPNGLTRGEIVKAMGRNPSEIYRMLERLVARHYVARSPEGDRYSLSLKLFMLSQRHPPLHRLVARAQPAMDAFAKAAEQSCHLGVYDRGNITIVAQVNSPGSWGLSIRLGSRVSLMDTGSGHVMLAFRLITGGPKCWPNTRCWTVSLPCRQRYWPPPSTASAKPAIGAGRVSRPSG